MNQVCRAACSVILLILFFCAYPVFAQEDPRLWNPDGIPLRQGTHLEWDSKFAQSSQGQTCVVWTDTRNGIRNVYAQLIDSDGSLQWESEGLLVAETDSNLFNPVIAAVDGGWIIAWISHNGWIDLGLDEALIIRAQKLDMSGQPLWTMDGIDVYDNSEADVRKFSMQIISDNNGGAFVAWEEMSSGVDVAAMHVTSQGTLDWNDALNVTNIVGSQSGIRAVSDVQGNMIIVWDDDRITNNPNIFGAKVMADGTLPWGDGVNGIPICSAVHTQNHVEICPDFSTGGVYCVWKDYRSVGDYPNDLYIQRVDGDGTVLWQENGLSLCDAPDNQLSVHLAASLNSDTQDGVVCCWSDLRVNGYVNEVYTQKVDPEGSMLWGENGSFVCGNSGPNISGETRDRARVISDHAGGAFVSWSDTRDSQGDFLGYDLYTARLDASGNNLWSECGVAVADGPRAQHTPIMTYSESASTVDLVYIDESATGSNDLMHQRLSASDGASMLDSADLLLAGIDSDATNPKTIKISGDRAAIVWVDYRGGSTGRALYYQIVNSAGEFTLPMHGLMVAPDSSSGSGCQDQSEPVLTSDGNGGFFVAFIDNRHQSTQIRLSRINSAGEVISDPAGVIIYNYPLDQQNPRICADGSGGCYIAWQGNDFSFTIDVFVHHFDENCEAVWGGPIQLTTDGTYDDILAALSPSENCCIAVWTSGDSEEQDIQAARVCYEGDVDWYRTVCDAPGWQSDASVIEDDDGGIFVSWADERDENMNLDIYAQHLTSTGEFAWEENGIVVNSSVQLQNKPCLAYSPEHGLYVVWEDFRNGVDINLYAQRIDEDGHLLWDTSGLLLCDENGDQDFATVEVNESGGIFVVWGDHRLYYKDIYGTNLYPSGETTDEWWVEGSGGAICEAYSSQTRPILAPISTEQTLVVWVDWRAPARYYMNAQHFQDLYMQLLNIRPMSNPEQRSESLPTSYSLDQNYPNPFNPSTTISFAIPKAGQTSLVVYDLLGRTVETLMNKPLAAGSYHVSWNASALPSGMYFYRLTAGEFSDVKKTVLLK